MIHYAWLIVLLSFSLVSASKAQTISIEPSAKRTVKLGAEVSGTGSKESFEPHLQKLGTHKHGAPEIESRPIERKDLADSLQLDIGNHRRKKAVNPFILNSFESNRYNDFTPADNTVAVSNGNIIVSAINSNVYYYDTQGLQLGFATFLRLIRATYPELRGRLYDPRVIYDQDEDRFILLFLHGSTSTESKLMVFFSKTNDPMDGWNLYALDGDITEQGYWFDYPNIALNKNTLFVGGNMFNNDNDFQKTVLVGIEKDAGYKGEDITYRHWDDIKTPFGDAFTIVPVEKGTRGSYNEKALFLATENDNDNILMLYEIDPLTQQLGGKRLSVPNYVSSSNSPQRGSEDRIDLGDNRMKKAIMIDGVIHAVHGTSAISGHGAIAYYRIDTKDNDRVRTQVFDNRSNNLYLGYPSIASAGTEWNAQEVVIAFTESGTNIYPRVCAISFDEEMRASDKVILREGEGPVDILSDDVERWGDYITVVNKFNSNTVWAFSCIGNELEEFSNYLFELSLDPVASAPQQVKKSTPVSTFPNPTADRVSVEFNLEHAQNLEFRLFDMNGKEINLLYRDRVYAGLKRFSFELNELESGAYFLKITGDDNFTLSERIIVE